MHKANRKVFMKEKQKLSICMISLCALILSACGNTAYPQNDFSSAAESESHESEEQTSTAENAIAQIDYQHGYYDDFSPEVYQQSETGSAMSYEEAMEMITDTNNGAIKSFYLVKTVKALTLGECEKLSGWNEWFSGSYALDYTPELKAESEYFGDKTIYEVEIVRDLLRSAGENVNMYVAISMGNPVEQREGDPVYSPDEMFTVAVYEPNDNSEIYSSCGGFMLRYDVTVSDGGYFAYSRNNYEIDALNIDGSENIDESAVTSTTVNPAGYSQKMPLEKLAEFIKNDWTQRGIV